MQGKSMFFWKKWRIQTAVAPLKGHLYMADTKRKIQNYRIIIL